MPRKYFAPYRGRHRRYNRSTAASTIQRGWKKKLKRRAGGLVSRTALANRRNINAMKKCVETKMISDVQITSTNTGPFSGQFVQNLVVDNVGQDVAAALPYSNDLLGGLAQGTGSKDRIGAWIHLKSITMHYCITAPPRTPMQQAHFNILVVHDQEPNAASDLSQLLALQSAAPAPQNWTQLAFQNLDTTGKNNRYKLLWRKTHVLSAEKLYVSTTVPPITQEAVGDVMRPGYQGDYYVQGGSKEYPLCVYGTKTFKLQYKINYGTDPTSVIPENQTIRVFAFQTAPIGWNQPTCRLDYHTRVRFQDA